MSHVNSDGQENPVVQVNPDKVKHLEFIQAVITRMAGNSFLLKGWSVTLIAAILALSSVEHASKWLAPIAFVAAWIFWTLDAYFLHQEQKYRKLWNIVRKRKDDQKPDFDLNVKEIKAGSYCGALFSKTTCPFHLALLATIIVAALAKFGLF